MDTPRVGPLTPIGNLLKSVSRVLLDPNGQSIDPTKSGGPKQTESVKRSTAESPLQDVGAATDKFQSLESMLPVEILVNPVLKGSEWAWKRLITSILENENNVLLDMVASENGQLTETEDVSQDATVKQTDQLLNGAFTSGVAEGAIQEAKPTITPTELSQPQSVTATQSAKSNTQSKQDLNGVPGESFASAMSETEVSPPIAVTSNVMNAVTGEATGSIEQAVSGTQANLTAHAGTHNEQVLFNTNQTDVFQFAPSSPSIGSNHSYEPAIKMLWSLLTMSAGQSVKDQVKAEIRGLQDKGSVVEFSKLNQADFKSGLPQTVQHWVVEDRLTASVQNDAYERIGQGIFFPPGQPPSGVRHAIRWHARKQTKITSRGKLIHRIQFDLQVNHQPVRCTLISAKPSLVVHFDTNDRSLQQHLQSGRQVIEQSLRNAGWLLEKWSVSPYDDRVEAE